MADDEVADLTTLLQAWRTGVPDAAERLMGLVHQELRRVAAARLRHERPDHTLEPAALVNEAYLRLAGQRQLDWQNRAQFFAIASREMRRILIDHARKRRAEKREGFVGERITVSEVADPAGQADADVLGLHDALAEFAVVNRRQADAIELRYFGGLTIEEIAAVTSVSMATVKRDLTEAKEWLRQRLKHEM
jgi:RNA polymerase sigma factor (TIGR02999 family)